jgi:hypothetical protein
MASYCYTLTIRLSALSAVKQQNAHQAATNMKTSVSTMANSHTNTGKPNSNSSAPCSFHAAASTTTSSTDNSNSTSPNTPRRPSFPDLLIRGAPRPTQPAALRAFAAALLDAQHVEQAQNWRGLELLLLRLPASRLRGVALSAAAMRSEGHAARVQRRRQLGRALRGVGAGREQERQEQQEEEEGQRGQEGQNKLQQGQQGGNEVVVVEEDDEVLGDAVLEYRLLKHPVDLLCVVEEAAREIEAMGWCERALREVDVENGVQLLYGVEERFERIGERYGND